MALGHLSLPYSPPIQVLLAPEPRRGLPLGACSPRATHSALSQLGHGRGLGPLGRSRACGGLCRSLFPVPPECPCRDCLTRCAPGTAHQRLEKRPEPCCPRRSCSPSSAGFLPRPRGERDRHRLFLGMAPAQTGLCLWGAFFPWGHAGAPLTRAGGGSVKGHDRHQTMSPEGSHFSRLCRA